MATAMPAEQLVRVLRAFLGTNNVARRQAEEAYAGWLRDHPNPVVSTMLDILNGDKAYDVGVRSMAAVLLRRIFDLLNINARQALTAETYQKAQAYLLAVLRKEQPAIGRITALTVGQLASVCFDTWPSLLPGVRDMILDRANPVRRSIGFTCLSKLCEFAFTNMEKHAENLKTWFQHGLQDQYPEVRLAAMQGVSAFVGFLESKAAVAAFATLVQPMFMAVGATIKAGAALEAGDMLKELVSLARGAPALYTAIPDNISHVGTGMLNVAKDKSADEDVRRLALELLVSLTEFGGATVHTDSTLVKSVIDTTLALMAELDDDTSWARKAYNPEQATYNDNLGEADTCAYMGTEAVYRLARALHGKIMLPVAFETIVANIRSADPKARRAAMLAAGLMGAGCHRAMKLKLAPVLAMVTNALSDTDVRVRYAALTSMRMFAEDFSDKSLLQVKHHKTFVPTVVAVMQDARNPMRVRCHAAMALAAFCAPGKCPSEIIAHYLATLVPANGLLLAASEPWAQQTAISLLSCVANSAGSLFADYYGTFMGGLKTLIARKPTTEASKMLRGRAIECFAIVGETAGERFVVDAKMVLGMLLAEKLPLSDAQTPFVLRTCSRIAGVMGAAFAPYLPIVLPPLLAAAKKEPEMMFEAADATASGNVEQGDDGMLSQTLHLKGVGALKVSLNTSQMLEKTMAVRSLFEYIDDLQAVFQPHAHEVAAVLAPLTVFKYSADIRLSACMALPRLAYSVVHGLKNKDLAPAQAFLTHTVDVLLKAFAAEPNADTRTAIVESLKDVTALCYESGDDYGSAPIIALSDADTYKMAQALTQAVADSVMRRRDVCTRITEMLGSEMDEAAHETVLDALQPEVDLAEFAVDGLGYLLKARKAAYLPLFQKVQVPVFTPLLQAGGPTGNSLRVNAMSVFIDVIEWCGAGASGYVRTLLPTLHACLLPTSPPDLRQCAAYGVGIIAQHAPTQLAPNVAHIVTALAGLVNAADAKSEENLFATENAASTLGKIAKYMGAAPSVNTAACLAVWLGAMPFVEDAMEACTSYDMLCEFVEAKHPAVLGTGGANLDRVLSLMGTALVGVEGGDGGEHVNASTIPRIVRLLKQVQRDYPTQLASAAAGRTLSDAQKRAIGQALSV